MKKSLVFIISLAFPVLSYSQNQEQQTGIVLENNGIIQSVEFLETETNFEIPINYSLFLGPLLVFS